MSQIDGETRLTGIIGYPLTYTLSPVFQNAAFEHLRLNWCYLPLVVEEKKLAQAVEGVKALGFAGLNVTMPYKEEMISFVDELSQEAQLAQAVNTVLLKGEKLIGYNTDGEGFLTSLKEDTTFDPKGKSAVLVGAGGAAKSVAASLCQAKVRELVIVNRTPRRAEELEEKLKNRFHSCKVSVCDLKEDLSKVFSQAELIVNATPVGMKGKSEVVFPVDYIQNHHLVCDLVYVPEETMLLKSARDKGAKVLGGIGMLVWQGAIAFEIWTGIKAPIDVMRRSIKAKK